MRCLHLPRPLSLRRGAKRMRVGMAAVTVLMSAVVAGTSGGPVASASSAGNEGVAATANGSDPNLSPEDRRWMREQWPYMELNDKVHGLVPATGTSPLAGTRIDLEHHRFYVYWADPAPDGFGDLQSWASQRDISLIIKRATFSEQQLMEAARQVTQLSEADRLELSVTLHTDGSGITVSAKSLP